MQFLDDGEVVIFGQENERGAAAENYDKSKQQKLTTELLLEMIKFVDKQHAEGRSVTNAKIRAWLQEVHGMEVHRGTVQRGLSRLGLAWSKLKCRKRTLGSFRLKAIRDFLIDFDKIVKDMETGTSDYVFAWMDESYVHNTHSQEYSYIAEGEEHIERTGSKGKRLVILHAITMDGPVCERDENGMPVSNLTWKGDTPHPTRCDDGKLTCETLWLAQSSAGDYHDNMNSEIFMRWVKKKLLPCFDFTQEKRWCSLPTMQHTITNAKFGLLQV